MSNTIKLSLISVALLSQLYAEDTITLKPIAITSTAIATDELKSTDAVEIYTAEDIQKAHVQNLYEFLNQQTSVTTMSNFGNPFTQKLDIHGYGSSNGNQNIVITVNGRRMNNIDSVPQLLSSISPESIEKIEIIKSSGIVVAGDGANAGVINITTKQTNDKEVSFYMGNYGLVDGSFYVGHADDKLAISVAGEAQKNDGIRDVDANGNKDDNQFSTGTFNLAYNPLDELEVRFGASFSDLDVKYSGSLTKQQYEKNPKQKGTYSVHQRFDTTVLTGGISYYMTDDLSVNADVNHEKKTSEYVGSSVYNYDYSSFKTNLNYKNDITSFIMGVDGFDGIVKNTKINLQKKNIAIFAMSQFRINDLTLKAGYRYERIEFKNRNGIENEKDNLHGIELGVNYTLSKTNSVFFNYAHSYQYASLDSLFSFFTGTFSGYVKPSKAHNYTLGYNYLMKQNKLKLSTYYIDLKDEIYYDAFTFANTNIDKSHKYGFDVYDNFIINNNFNMLINYNYVKAIIDEKISGANDYTGKELPGVSNHTIKGTFNYLPNIYTTFSLTQEYRSQAYAANDFNNNFTQKQDAYNSTDISATYTKDNWEVFAKINNLFNQKNGLWIKDDAIYPLNFTTTALVGFKLKY